MADKTNLLDIENLNLDEKKEMEDEITPWSVVCHSKLGVNYSKLIERFGCFSIDDYILNRFKSLIKQDLHHFLTRKIFFSHRDFNHILDLYEKKKPFYIYTGRGPSDQNLHLGHIIPFMFTKWLQDIFDVPVIIQLTDDEKFLWKDSNNVEEYKRFAIENAKDIIALGFDVEKTFIFLNTDYMSQCPNFYENIIKFQKRVSYKKIKSIFGLDETSNIGKISFPANQAVPAFSSSFPLIFNGRNDIHCLIPSAIDQDPYFRLTRDVTTQLKYKKPSTIYCKFFPALQGAEKKMSSTEINSSISLVDDVNVIKNKIFKHAFSGGKDNAEEHRKYGGDCQIDVSYQYLLYFMKDESRLSQIKEEYSSGKMFTGFLKKELVELLQKFIADYKEKRKTITDEIAYQYMKPRKLKYDYLSK